MTCLEGTVTAQFSLKLFEPTSYNIFQPLTDLLILISLLITYAIFYIYIVN